jgi:microcystin-dependent protein
MTLTTDKIPPHSHSFEMPCNNVVANTKDPADAFPSITDTQPVQYSDMPNQTMGAANTNVDGGLGQPLSIQNPYLVIRFLIALQGFYPERD